jgi:inositol transport system permease protein
MVAFNSVIVAMLCALGMGVLIGFINGLVITTFNIPAFIMTLAVTTIARGSVLLMTNATPVSGMDKSFLIIGQGYIGIISVPIVILLVLFVITLVLLNKTRFGRYLFAVGGNINAAKASGINSKLVIIKAFILDGALAAIAGVVLMSRINSGQPAAGVGYEFDAITGVVVGGTSLAGGVGSIGGTIIGVIIVAIIGNIQNLLNVHTYWQQIVKGLIILVAVIVDMISQRKNDYKK